MSGDELDDVFPDNAPKVDPFAGDAAVRSAAAEVAATLPPPPSSRPKRKGGSKKKEAPVPPSAERLAQMRPMGDVEYDDTGGIVRVEFTVPGKPMTWARAQRGRYGSTYTPDDRLSKMAEVRDAWYSLGLPPFAKDAFLRMMVTVYCERPDGHWRTNGELKEWAKHRFPGGGKNGGDIDNYCKLPKDALNLVAYHDDTQIVGYLADTEKRYVEPGKMPRTVLAFEPVRAVNIAEVGAQEELILQG